MLTRVAVYGTLKKGLSNHSLLQDAEFLGQDRLNNLILYDLGPYPGACLAPSAGIEVEVYEVNSRTLAHLDRLEDLDENNSDQGLYQRRQLPTRYGMAWVYLYNQATRGYPVIRQGGWPVKQL